MSDNWVVSTLENALSNWNDHLAEIWSLVSQTPESFRGGEIWTVIVSIHNALVGFGYGLLVLFFAMDGVKNRFQEMLYVTIPSMKPQMLFAAVMQIVGAFQNGTIATLLAGNPTPGYSAQLIVNHVEDYGFIRYEMGYAAAVSVVLLLIVQIFSVVANRLFGERD